MASMRELQGCNLPNRSTGTVGFMQYDSKPTRKSTSEWPKRNKMKVLLRLSFTVSHDSILIVDAVARPVHAGYIKTILQREQCKRLNKTFCRCLVAVLAAKGDPTSY